MTHTLKDKLVLITGAASGIGLATAQLFASQGADLALVDISPKVVDVVKELQDQRVTYPEIKVSAHVYDLTVSSNIDLLFAEIKEAHKEKHFYPTVLINSAGIIQEKKLTDINEQDYDRMININLKSVFLVTQAFVKPLVANFANVKFDSPTQSYASIVNLSSAVGRYGGNYGFAHYGIAKAGIEGFSKCVAKEYGSFRIRCNAIMPYIIETPLINTFMTNERRTLGSERVALKRFGRAEEVAQLIYFLASDSSSYITGTGIDINGGL